MIWLQPYGTVPSACTVSYRIMLCIIPGILYHKTILTVGHISTEKNKLFSKYGRPRGLRFIFQGCFFAFFKKPFAFIGLGRVLNTYLLRMTPTISYSDLILRPSSSLPSRRRLLLLTPSSLLLVSLLLLLLLPLLLISSCARLRATGRVEKVVTKKRTLFFTRAIERERERVCVSE